MDANTLLAEVDDVIRTMPPIETISGDSYDGVLTEWFGRANAVLEEYDSAAAITFSSELMAYRRSGGKLSGTQHLLNMLNQLHKMRSRLMLKTRGPLSVSIDKGLPFDYFDEVRKIIERATTDLLFVDPYMNAEFVSRYLTHVRPGVAVRLLTGGKMMPSLKSAVHLFREQSALTIEMRVSGYLHDRYLFMDRNECYVSGASFKDGGKSAPTSITQIVDASQELLKTWERQWEAARHEP